MSIGTDMRAAALDLIRTMGTTGTLVQARSETYDPVTGINSSTTSASYSVTCTHVQANRNRYRTDGPVSMADGIVYMAAGDVEPLVDDVIVIEGRRWGIVEVQPYRIATTAVAWKLGVRMGGA